MQIATKSVFVPTMSEVEYRLHSYIDKSFYSDPTLEYCSLRIIKALACAIDIISQNYLFNPVIKSYTVRVEIP